MKFKIFILLLSFVHVYGQYLVSQRNGYLTSLQKEDGEPLDTNFLSGFLDLIDPRNYVKVANKAAGDIVREVAAKLGASNDVVHLANIKAPEMIRHHGFPVEVHNVVTQDGYIIEIHRIPYGKFGGNTPRGVIILAHGILCSSACWLFLGPDKALPYLLADLGYDVWLTNIRGNTYGRKHQSINPVNSKFWDFSFHEVGYYDYPAIIDYVQYVTGAPDLFFVAHSAATTAFYVMCSERPEYARKIRAHVSLTPAAHFKHLTNPLLYFLAQFSNMWHKIIHLIGMDEFLPSHDFMTRVSGTLCTIEPLSELICSNTMFALTGFNRKQLNNTIIPIIFGHTPAGTSIKTLIHYGQLVRNFRDRFQRFSHGLLNPVRYGSIFPPAYDLSRVIPPTYCFYGRGDWLVTEKDAVKTCSELPNVHGAWAVDDKDFNHNDFLYASSAKDMVYDKVISLLAMH